MLNRTGVGRYKDPDSNAWGVGLRPDAAGVADCVPKEAWEQLTVDPASALIDVRTRAEWAYVGTPDLSKIGKQALLVEWRMLPDMAVNPAFVDTLADQLGGAQIETLFFLCRSGARSREAAATVEAAYAAAGRTMRCVNVAEGFEGDLDADRHRGRVNGWKVHGLPWRQT